MFAQSVVFSGEKVKTLFNVMDVKIGFMRLLQKIAQT